MGDYFDAGLGHEEIARRYPGMMKSTARFDARAVRDELLKRGGQAEDGFVRYAYRPFDSRWLYWEGETKLLDEKRAVTSRMFSTVTCGWWPSRNHAGNGDRCKSFQTLVVST